MNTLSLSVSNPSRSKGSSLRSSVKTALNRPCSRTSNGPHSVHPVAMKDPDRRVQEAIALVFTKFAELQTVRQVHLWMRHERLPLPAVRYGPEGRSITWKLPVYNTLHHILTNPIYAGAYAFGRTGSHVTIEAGRKRIVRGFRKDRSAWEALILDHHEGYISWAEFERNQRLISDNANGQSFMSRGSVRRGEALL